MFVKDPQDKKDYGVDWSARLEDGETLSASTWTVETGLTESTPAPSLTTTVTTIWLSGGTAGERYEVTNHVTTSAGREYDASFTVMVEDV